MISIDRHIEYLLLDRDCVIVPGLGAFVAMYQSASVEGEAMLPPSRSVAFNPEIVHNDALLATSIARAEGISYEAALTHLHSGVAALRAQLAQDGRFTINRVGTLLSTPEGSLEFCPAENPVSSLQYMGLPTVALAPKEAAETDLPEPAKHRHLSFSAARIPAAAACVAVLLTFALMLWNAPMAPAPVQHASLSPSISHSAAAPAQKRAARFFLSIPAGEEPERVDTTFRRIYRRCNPWLFKHTDTPSAAAHRADQAGLRISDGEDYCIVVASLPSMSRARKFMASTGVSGLQVLNQNGRYRVIAGTAPTEDAAKSIAGSRNVQKRYPGAWVTTR